MKKKCESLITETGGGMMKKNNTSRRNFLKIAGGSTILLPIVKSEKYSFAQKNRSRPNILLILTDQQYNDTISAGGCKHVNTPALDKLMKNGTSFKISLTTNPVCCPARSSILTGRASSETGVITNRHTMRKGIPNIGEWLQKNTNYETVYVGKWHLPKSFTHFIPGFRVLHTGIGGQGNVCDTAVSLASAAFLKNRKKDKPFCMVSSFLQPHDICEWLRLNTYNSGKLPYSELKKSLPPLPDNFDSLENQPELIKRMRKKNEGTVGKWSKEHWQYYRWCYYRHIEMVDAEIGRVLQAIEDNNYKNETLIIFTADHGEGLGAHQMTRKSSPYRESLSVPFIISWPGQLPENKIDKDHPVSGFDIMPTICDYIGIKSPDKTTGLSVRPIMENKTKTWRKYLVSETTQNQARVVRSKQYKYIAYADDITDQFFNLKNDPGETKNLISSSSHASALKEHQKFLIQWEKGLDVVPGLKESEAWKNKLKKI